MAAPFITLYVPRKEWFQNLVTRLMLKEESLSSQLIVLILEDMIRRKTLLADELAAAQSHLAEHRKNKGKEKKSSKAAKKDFTTFNLYLPIALRWIPKKIDQIGKSEGHSNRFKGTYIWNLALDHHRSLIPKSVKETL